MKKRKQLKEARVANAIAHKHKEQKLEKEHAFAKEGLLAGQAILQEANAKLLAAVKAKDFKPVSVAQMMLDQGQKAANEASAKQLLATDIVFWQKITQSSHE